jgi:hypothetical protein
VPVDSSLEEVILGREAIRFMFDVQVMEVGP